MFFKPEDIANRAAQHLGKPQIRSLTEQSDVALEINACYDRIRDAELARNLWTFATRDVALRALDTTSVVVSFETWSSTYTYIDGTSGYPAGYVVKDAAGNLWVSLVNGNTTTPGAFGTAGAALTWESYFGNRAANVWNDSIQNTITTNNTSYHLGELVYIAAAGSYKIYVSIVEGNQNEPDLVDAFSATTMYRTGAVVSQNGTNYQSLQNLNFGNTPPSASWWTTIVTNPTVSGSWIQLTGATISQQQIIYPVLSGPSSDPNTRNCFLKPAGWLREAPQDPKAGVRAWLGAHVGLAASDIRSEGGYLTSPSSDLALLYRFVARIIDVGQMDVKFCEGLAARLAYETAPRLAEKEVLRTIRNDALGAYRREMEDARTVNAIEAGPVEQEEDLIITVRY